MKTAKKNKTIHPKPYKNGNTIVRIYRYSNKGYEEFKVADSTSGKRVFHTCATLEDANKKAKEIGEKLSKGEVDVLTLRSADRAAYVRALEYLKPHGIPLEVAALHYAEAVKVLGSDLVLEAAKHFAKTHARNMPTKTVTEVKDELLLDRDGLSTRYKEDLRYRCGKFAAAFQMPIASITAQEVREFLAGLKLGARSYNNFIGSIRTLFEFAKEREWLPSDHDIMKRVRPTEEEDGEIEIYTPSELARLLGAAKDKFLPSLAIAAFAGLRSAEIVRQQWADINFERGFIRVTAVKGNTAKKRLVPISANLAAWLQPIAKTSGKVWPHSRPHFYEEQENTAKGTATASVPAIQWKHNALRHSFISYRVALTQNIPQVAIEAGNSVEKINTNYRELVFPDDAKTYFSILPEVASNIIPNPIRAAVA